jgi:hypothetical protein
VVHLSSTDLPRALSLVGHEERVVSNRRMLQASLHDAPNPLDPVATNWAETRASERVAIDVELTGVRLARGGVALLVPNRPLAADAVWAIFIDGWVGAQPVLWERIGVPLEAGAPFLLEPGTDRVTMASMFTIRNSPSTAR